MCKRLNRGAFVSDKALFANARCAAFGYAASAAIKYLFILLK